jgi:hypothetical protein
VVRALWWKDFLNEATDGGLHRLVSREGESEGLSARTVIRNDAALLAAADGGDKSPVAVAQLVVPGLAAFFFAVATVFRGPAALVGVGPAVEAFALD